MTSFLPGYGEQKLSPQAILDMNYAFARTAMLVASVRLHIFSYLANRTLTPAELAAYANTLSEPIGRLLERARGTWICRKGGRRLSVDFHCRSFFRLQDTQLFHVAGPFPVVIAKKEEGL